MYILITYDVATSTPKGAKRLRRVAKICLDYGQRVQNSVFECKLGPSHYVELKQRLLNEIDLETDSIRIYNLGNNWQKKVEHYGKNEDYNIEGVLLV